MATARAGPYSRLLGTLEEKVWGVARTRWGKRMSARGQGPPPGNPSPQVLANRLIVAELLPLLDFLGPATWRDDWDNSDGKLPGWHSLHSWLIRNSEANFEPPFWSLTYDGTNDYAGLAALDLNSWTTGSMECWVYRPTYQHYVGWLGDVNQAAYGNPGIGFVELSQDVDVSYWPYFKFTDPANRCSLNLPNATADEWHHFAASWDRAGSALAYLDGVYVTGASLAAVTGDVTPLGAFRMGTNASNYPEGQIAAARLWSTVRSEANFYDNMLLPFLGPLAALELEWPTLPGQEQLLLDYSGNDRTGQLGASSDPDISDPAWTVPTDCPAYPAPEAVHLLDEANHIPKALGPVYAPPIVVTAPAPGTITLTWDPLPAGPYAAAADIVRGFTCLDLDPGTNVSDARIVPDTVTRTDGTYSFSVTDHAREHLVVLWFRNVTDAKTRYSPVAWKKITSA